MQPEVRLVLLGAMAPRMGFLKLQSSTPLSKLKPGNLFLFFPGIDAIYPISVNLYLLFEISLIEFQKLFNFQNI